MNGIYSGRNGIAKCHYCGNVFQIRETDFCKIGQEYVWVCPSCRNKSLIPDSKTIRKMRFKSLTRKGKLTNKRNLFDKLEKRFFNPSVRNTIEEAKKTSLEVTYIAIREFSQRYNRQPTPQELEGMIDEIIEQLEGKKK